MINQNRETGIDILGDIPWGTHFCQFYETKQDLIDILVPYFKAGLENNELCLWITSEPLEVEEAKAELKKKVKGLEAYIKKGQIEILDHTQWYTISGQFKANEVLQGWLSKENESRKRGFAGLRITGNTFWLEKRLWKNFTKYESKINNIVGKYRILALCSYSINRINSPELIEVVNNHQFTLIKREREWQIIESPPQKYSQLMEGLNAVVYRCDPKTFTANYITQNVENLSGYTVEEWLQDPDLWRKAIHPKDKERVMRELRKSARDRKNTVIRYWIRRKDRVGRCIENRVSWETDDRGRTVAMNGVMHDITEIKGAEKELRRYCDHLEYLAEKSTLRLKESNKRLKRAKERLRESEQWHRKIIENIQDGIMIIEEGEITYINNRACEILGYSREELAKMSGLDIAAPEEKERLLRIMEKSKKTDIPPKDLDVWIIRKDGTRRSISNRHSIVQKRNGSIAHLVVTVDDTERRQAEEALKESENKYSAMVEQALDGVIIVQDETIQFANRASAQFSGYPVEELVGTKCLNMVAIENREMVAEWYRSKMAGEKTSAVCEFKIICKDGIEKSIESSASTIQYQGRPALLSIFRDITERRQAEQALLNLEQEIRLIADNVPGLVSYVDAEGRYRFVNKQYEEWFGLPRMKIIGRHFRQVLGDSAFKLIERRVNAALSGQRVSYEEAIPYARVGTRWVKAQYIPDVDEGGKTRGFFALVTDISSLKETEKELQRLLEETARSRRMVLAFSQAAQAVLRVRTPEEVYRTVGNELISLGYYAAIFILSEDRANLKLAHLTVRPETLKTAEKLSGLSAINYSFPLEPGSFFYEMAQKGETVFLKQSADRFAEALPEKVRPLAKQLSELMGLEQSILAPLVVSRKRFGILVVFGAGLDEVDIPAVTAFANQAAIAIENAQLLEETTKHRKELQRLSSRLIDIQEEERSRISRELHDEMGQALTAMKINLAGIEKKLPEEASRAAREQLAETCLLTDQMLENTRELSLDLRPSMLDDLGLKPTLRWYLNRFAQRVNIKIGFDAKDFKKKISAELETVLYRVVQEALTNIVRHAQASEVSVHLESSKSRVCLTITDNGQGFDIKKALSQGMTSTALGLIGMRENVQMLGGHFSIQSRPGKGVQLSVELPLND